MLYFWEGKIRTKEFLHRLEFLCGRRKDFREAFFQVLIAEFCEETSKDDLPFSEKIVSGGRIGGMAILITESKREEEKTVQAVYGGMKLKSYVKNAVLTERLDGIKNGGKMIRHD